jgi:excisionase family DNA binding protein
MTRRSRETQNGAMEIEESAKPNDRPAPDTFLSRTEVARRFGVSLSTVTRWARTGMIRAVRTPGGHYRYPACELLGSRPSADAAVNPEGGGPHERHPGTQ